MSSYGVKTEFKYFAAANGYKGFKSYFPTIFNPREYDKIFILKGGPGTGKSTIMKSIANELYDKEAKVESIHCSSDPLSLDGVIIDYNQKKVAVIDGTAPHSTDPIFPGAIEEIINLGDHWDEKILQDHRDIIIGLGEKKSKSYMEAYAYLNLAGEITTLVDKEISEYYKNNDLVEEIISPFPEGNSNVKTRLISSFGKNGFCRLNSLSLISEKRYSVVGVYGSEYFFSKALKTALDRKKVNYTHFPSSLSPDKTYGFYIPESKTLIVCDQSKALKESEIIDTAKNIKLPFSEKSKCMLEFLWKEREVMLWNSADEFKKASDEHFSLEKIYTAAMDFEKLSALQEEIRRKILLLLSLNLQKE